MLLFSESLCVEYNKFGNVIQRNTNAKCKACPKMYYSTDVFQCRSCNITTYTNFWSKKEILYKNKKCSLITRVLAFNFLFRRIKIYSFYSVSQ